MKVPQDHLENLLELLERKNYENFRRDLAEKWILSGDWSYKNRDILQYSDFYPTPTQITSLGENYISEPVAKTMIQDAVNRYKIELRKEFTAQPIEPAHMDHIREEIRIQEGQRILKLLKRTENISDQEKEIKALTIQIMALTTRFQTAMNDNRILKKEIEYLERRIKKAFGEEVVFMDQNGQNQAISARKMA